MPLANSISPKPRLATREAAAYIGFRPGTLEVDRVTKRHKIPYLKVGRKVFYLVEDLDLWLESRRVGGEA